MGIDNNDEIIEDFNDIEMNDKNGETNEDVSEVKQKRAYNKKIPMQTQEDENKNEEVNDISQFKELSQNNSNEISLDNDNLIEKNNLEDRDDMSENDDGITYEENEENEENVNFSQINGDEIDNAIKLKDVEVSVKAISKNTVFDDEMTNDLYNEFNSFLEAKSEIIADSGTKDIIPSGITLLDKILGGGFPCGCFHMIAGAPGSGKSMLCMQILGNAQRKYKGLLGGYLDSEEATSIQRMWNLGVRNPKIKPITDITLEKVFKYLETMCLFKQSKKLTMPSVVIWDSVANTNCEKERTAESINSVIGLKARILSLLMPKYVAKCAQNNIAWIAVNQLREELAMGPFSSPKDLRFLSNGKSLPGGQSIKFNSFALLEMRACGVLTEEKFGINGIVTKVKVVKNKLFAPGIEIELIGDFVNGFSDIWTSWNFLAKNKFIHTGAWNFLKNYPEKKIRTKDFPEVYNTDEKFKEEFDRLLLESVESEILSKYKVSE
jgi:RecA/RadA recombinase